MGKKGGSKPQYQRVIPKFLQQYKELLEPQRRPAYEDEDAPAVASSNRPSAAAAQPRADESEFGDYTADEVAALEAYKEKHPHVPIDKEALRDKIKALSSSMTASSAAADTSKDAGVGDKRKHDEAVESEPVPVEPLEYVNAEGSIKFNKPAASATSAGSSSAAGSAIKKKRTKKAAAVKNASLLSFDDEE